MMWFLLEELEMVMDVRQSMATYTAPAVVMKRVAGHLGAMEGAMESYGLYDLWEFLPVSKWPDRFIVNHCSAPHGVVLGSKPGLGRGDTEAVVMPAPDAGAEGTEIVQLEGMVEPEVPDCDAKVVKPHHVVHEDAHCFNAPPHRVKYIREVLKDEDTFSICTESEANTVLELDRDWHRSDISGRPHTGGSAFKVSMAKAGDTVKAWWNMDKVKIHPPKINLRNIHDLMVVGGLYPPTDTPPPLNLGRMAGRRSTR
jgi:hypothetical protein